MDLTKLTQGINTSIQGLSKKVGVQSAAVSAPKFNTGILDKDTVSFSKNVKKAIYPFTDKTTQVPQHHQINGYNNSIRYAINSVEKGKPLDEEDKWALNLVKKLDEAFKNLPPLEDDFIFYRGRAFNFMTDRFNQDFKVIDGAKAGDIIVPDKAYSYGAFKKELADNWSRDMMMEIHVPKGAKVSRNMEHGGEVVFPRGAEYRLISKEKDNKGVLQVVLEYILPEK